MRAKIEIWRNKKSPNVKQKPLRWLKTNKPTIIGTTINNQSPEIASLQYYSRIFHHNSSGYK